MVYGISFRYVQRESWCTVEVQRGCWVRTQLDGTSRRHSVRMQSHYEAAYEIATTLDEQRQPCVKSAAG